MDGNTIHDPLLTPEEAANYLGFALQTVYNKASAGELPSKKLGRALRFRLSELNRWIEEEDAKAKAARSEALGASAPVPADDQKSVA